MKRFNYFLVISICIIFYYLDMIINNSNLFPKWFILIGFITGCVILGFSEDIHNSNEFERV